MFTEYRRIATILFELAVNGPLNLSQLSDILIAEGLRPVSARPATTRLINYLEEVGLVETVGKGPRGARLVDVTPRALYYMVSLTHEDSPCTSIKIVSRYAERHGVRRLREISRLAQTLMSQFRLGCRGSEEIIRELASHIAFIPNKPEEQEPYLERIEKILRDIIANTIEEIIDHFGEDHADSEETKRRMGEVVNTMAKILDAWTRNDTPVTRQVLYDLREKLQAKYEALKLSLELARELAKLVNTTMGRQQHG